MRIRYRLRDLLRGRVASIEAEGLELRARLVDGQLELAGLEPPAGSAGGGFGLPAWPDQMVLRAAEVQLETPWGQLRLPLSAELRPGRPEAEFTLKVAGGQLINLAGRLDADLDCMVICRSPGASGSGRSAPRATSTSEPRTSRSPGSRRRSMAGAS